jgi:hypothetical protein
VGKPLVRFCEGLGYNSSHGRDIVAPSGNQAANRENKLRSTAWGVPSLLKKDPDLKKSRFYQEVYAEGHDEGMEEGRHGEALALVLRLLRRRLGTLPAGAEERIAALPVPRIDALGEALLDFAQPADLLDWLDRTSP